MLNKLLAGASASKIGEAIEDVFSTWLYAGNGSTQTINNGVNLSGKGGLVWIKGRSGATDHALYDTVRGSTKDIVSNNNTAETTQTTGLTSFSSTGFSLGALAKLNTNAATYTSWAFCKALRFFDVVTYTGNGSNRTVSHGLGVVPGCIIVKRTDTAADWQVYHRSLANTEYAVLNSTAAKATGATRWNSTTPTSSVFSLGTDSSVNASGGTYVAYIFAHDPLGPSGTGSDGLIACGSYTGNGSATGPVISLGWEPQWLLIKNSSGTGNWQIVDNTRGLLVGIADLTLQANLANSESSVDYVTPTATGFQVTSTNADVNTNGSTYVYVAVRRGPMKTPTSGTQVFATQSNGNPVATTPYIAWNSTFPVDMFFQSLRASGGHFLSTRFTKNQSLALHSNTAESAGSEEATGNANVIATSSFDLTGRSAQMFRRAPNFFDIVAYTGNGSVRTIDHNLGAVPELILVRCRSAINDWAVYFGDNTDYLLINSTAQPVDDATYWNDTSPTSSVFTVGTNVDVNSNNQTYLAFLFASCPSVSKIGTYTGNGSSQTIDCGFTGGARFILIKRTNSTGDWYFWDTARGIVAANDPRMSLNTTAAEVTTDDSVDPNSSGFIVNQNTATNINVNAATYLYFAIA